MMATGSARGASGQPAFSAAVGGGRRLRRRLIQPVELLRLFVGELLAGGEFDEVPGLLGVVAEHAGGPRLGRLPGDPHPAGALDRDRPGALGRAPGGAVGGLLDRPAGVGRRRGPGPALLDDVRQLVRHQPLPLGGGRRVPPRAEDHVGADGVRLRTQRLGRPRGAVAGVHPDPAEVVPEPRLHLRPRARVERPSPFAQRAPGGGGDAPVEQPGDRPVPRGALEAEDRSGAPRTRHVEPRRTRRPVARSGGLLRPRLVIPG
jgi:hypothetical protein